MAVEAWQCDQPVQVQHYEREYDPSRSDRWASKINKIHNRLVLHNDVHDLRRVRQRVARYGQRENLHHNYDGDWGTFICHHFRSRHYNHCAYLFQSDQLNFAQPKLTTLPIFCYSNKWPQLQLGITICSAISANSWNYTRVSANQVRMFLNFVLIS